MRHPSYPGMYEYDSAVYDCNTAFNECGFTMIYNDMTEVMTIKILLWYSATEDYMSSFISIRIFYQIDLV